MIKTISKIIRKGPVGIAKAVLNRTERIYHKVRTAGAIEYCNPTISDLVAIEVAISAQGMPCQDLIVDIEEFEKFVRQIGFPSDYHGGVRGGVYDEKLLEHFIAWKYIGLGDTFSEPYVDIAGGLSPWARLLRERGIEAYAIDLSLPPWHSAYSYYRQEDATKTKFQDSSIGGGSLQCAYEMFAGDDDILLLKELARILKPGGRVVISPLYTHKHPCYYQTPEYYGASWGDAGARRYIRRDIWGVRSSRKYSAETLKMRVWNNAIQFGLLPSLHVLRNKNTIGAEIYLSYVLILDKPIN